MDSIDDVVRRAAECGARLVTSELQLVRDAADRTLQRWRSKGAHQGSIANPAAWAFRVGKNAVRGLRSKFGGPVKLESSEFLDTLQPRTVQSAVSPDDRARLREAILGNERNFKGRQFVVAMKLTESGMSLHLAAQELGMERCNLKRSFRGALLRLIRVET